MASRVLIRRGWGLGENIVAALDARNVRAELPDPLPVYRLLLGFAPKLTHVYRKSRMSTCE